MTVAENAIAAFDAAHDDVLAGLFELAGIAANPPGRRIQV